VAESILSTSLPKVPGAAGVDALVNGPQSYLARQQSLTAHEANENKTRITAMTTKPPSIIPPRMMSWPSTPSDRTETKKFPLLGALKLVDGTILLVGKTEPRKRECDDT
jgi:hypothetical protein